MQYRGVSLIELMVALAVLAILVTVGAPGMQQLVNGQRAASSANEILSGLALARAEAIRRNTNMRFCLGNSSGTWELRAGTSTTVLRQGDLSKNITVSSVNTSAVGTFSCIDYRSDGLPYSENNLVTNGRMSVSIGSITRNVHIKTGSIYVD